MPLDVTGGRTGPVDRFEAVIFDVDGVVTRTASVHAAAWKAMFDSFLRAHADSAGEAFVPFTDDDYRSYVDGMSRFDGVSRFLASRGIALPYGEPGDSPDSNTVCGLGNRKNAAFLAEVERDGVAAFESTAELLAGLRTIGIRTAAVSASENCAAVLNSAGVAHLFDARVDGLDAMAFDLPGKPDPATFLEAALRLGVEPSRSAVVEDALAGVEAGRRGGFGLVVGVDRTGHPDDLIRGGADVVVSDLSELIVSERGRWSVRAELQSSATLPDALDTDRIHRLAASRVAVFLDYDGTLTPIVTRPELAVAPEGTAALLEELARQCTVGLISGRDLSDLCSMIDPAGVWMAGSHGFDVRAPDGLRHQVDAARPYVAELRDAADELDRAVSAVPGAWVERKAFAVAIHYRQVDDQLVPRLKEMVDRVADAFSGLRCTGGKRIFELRPAVDWDKGRALWFLLEQAGLGPEEVVPIYIGDDDTDEDAFAALTNHGVGIVVTEDDRRTAATQRLRDPSEVRSFLQALTLALRESVR